MEKQMTITKQAVLNDKKVRAILAKAFSQELGKEIDPKELKIYFDRWHLVAVENVSVFYTETEKKEF